MIKECFKGYCSPECPEAAQPSCSKFHTSWATAFNAIKRVLWAYLGAKKSFAAFTATNSLLLQFSSLSRDKVVFFYFKNLLLWFQMVFLPLPTLSLMFNVLPQSHAALLCYLFPFPSQLTLLFSPQSHVTQLLQLSSSSQLDSMDRFLHRALVKSQPCPCPSVLPIHTKRIRSFDCKCTHQMLQQQMLQQHRTAGCSVIQFTMTRFWVAIYITGVLKSRGLV